jgi:hypothetical protein
MRISYKAMRETSKPGRSPLRRVELRVLWPTWSDAVSAAPQYAVCKYHVQVFPQAES